MEEKKEQDLNEEKKDKIQDENLEGNLENEETPETPEVSEVLEDLEFELDETEVLKEEVFKLRNDKKKLSNEQEALKERLLRLNAEYDNYRKRTTKEKESIYVGACEDILKEMLPVLDNLERAVAVDGSVEDLKKGIEMTIRQFQVAFEKLGVTEIETDNGFDPNLHQAVMHVEDSNLEQNVVAEVFQKGYKKGDKVIRHTMVKVAN
ncbi:molecular chaperone GrpE [Clostridium cavendishii DSM 21758]|uniref:Protein GrpE n=1 Tax=Clostridium cavendishii DSM 21758 TaxID=1121302 RepID=A0A1M6APG6_9CLOT|nr:nucleotide exchange factor GrpE [Clostridium cavendishii]SHI38093.1 molecular chaperone GrpE [Clostridium cavendishii DSM 21758]